MNIKRSLNNFQLKKIKSNLFIKKERVLYENGQKNI